MYIDKLIKKEVITLLVSVSLLVIVFIGVTYAKFLSVDKGQDTVINMGDLNISFCKDTTCDTTYTNIGQVIGTKVENGTTVPAGIYPFKDNSSYSNETPYIFKVENTGSLDSTVKIKLKEDVSFTPSGDYSDYARLTSKYASHLKVAIKKKILYKDTEYQFGDVNMDGLVNVQDVNLVLQASTENATLTDTQKKLIGLDSSATISAVHAANILKILNGTSESSYSTKVYTYTDLEDGVIFKDDIIKTGESATYFLWLYLDETTPNDAQKTYFVGNIDVDGEYIPKVNPVSFSSDSWDTIISAVKKGNISKYNVGDTKTIDMGTYGTPYIFKVENTGSLDSTVKIKLKEDASFTPSGDYSSYARLTSKYADHLKVAIKKKILYQDTGYQFGDVNMDGLVNLQDVNLVLQAATENATLTDVQKKLIGLDSSTRISAVHAANILQILNGTSESSYSTKVYTYSDLEDGVIFKNDIIKLGESATYFLWLYLDETTPNDAQKTYFVGNIDVDGEFIPKVNPVSFATDSWETIITAVKENNISKYKVGDTKTIDMGTYGTHTLRIANKSTPSECSTSGFSQSACGFVLEFADIITTHAMNDTSTNVGGWPATTMRTFVNNDIYNSLPSELRNAIIDTTVVSGHGSTSGESNFTSTDKLYLLAPKEIYTDWSYSYDTARDVTRQLDYYKNLGTSTSNYSGAIKKNGTSASTWWLRAAYSNTTTGFFRVIFNGDWRYDSATGTYGVAPAFRLG